jgi:hypothetical protein
MPRINQVTMGVVHRAIDELGDSVGHAEVGWLSSDSKVLVARFVTGSFTDMPRLALHWA